MISNNQVKYIKSLHLKKYRQKYAKFLVEGSKMVQELLTQSVILPDSVWATHQWSPAQDVSCPINYIADGDLERISTLSTPASVMAIAHMPALPALPETVFEGLSFYLDAIRDPGNLGAILRVADWFGIKRIFVSADCAEVWSPKAVQASMGSCFRVQVFTADLSELLEKWPDLPVFGAVMDGENAFAYSFPTNGLLVIGNEGHGIAPELEQLLTVRLTIPKAPGAGAESLNAAVATGILAALFSKKR